MGIAHFDDGPSHEFDIGHLRGRWTMLGEASGSVGVGARRIQVPAGSWSTPAHEHGSEEEIFYVMAGRGLTWQKERTAEIGAGDCIVYRAGGGAHSLHALEDLDVLAFGPRHRTPGVSVPSARALAGRTEGRRVGSGRRRGGADPVRARGRGRPAGAARRARGAADDDRQRGCGARPAVRTRAGHGGSDGTSARRRVP